MWKPRQLYSVWASMRSRCSNPNVKHWKDYGGRGVRVCERWSSFAAFVEDMAPRPEGAWLDRIDPNGNYEPGNCRWATPLEQGRNRRRHSYIDVDGRPTLASELAEKCSVAANTIARRISLGWTVEEATTLPLRTRPPRLARERQRKTNPRAVKEALYYLWHGRIPMAGANPPCDVSHN